MANHPEDGPCEVTITAPDREWLQAFVRELVEDRLAAAAHIDTMETIYRWRDNVESAIEARVRLHTVLSAVDVISERVGECHPFAVPCVAVLPIVSGSEKYLEWLTANSSRG